MNSVQSGYLRKEVSQKWSDMLHSEATSLTRTGIGAGLGGVALYFYLEYKATGSKNSLDRFFNFFELAIERVNAGEEYHALLLADLTELCYLLSVTAHTISERHDTVPLQESLEDCILQMATQMTGMQNFDPFTGAFYPAYYFKQVNAPPAILQPFTELIRQGATETGKGLFFDSRFQENEQCLSIGHGLAFFIIFLCGLAPEHIPLEENRQLVRGFVSFILNHKKDFTEEGCFFPDYTGHPGKTRLSLCYGDAGILFALLRAADWLSDSGLKNNVRSMLSQMCTRTMPAQTRIQQLNLLYGESGMLLYYRYLNSLSASPELYGAACFWEQSLLAKLAGTNWDYYFSGQFRQKEGIQPLTFSEGITGVLAGLYAADADRTGDILFPFYLI
jgi:hypothetical protein